MIRVLTLCILSLSLGACAIFERKQPVRKFEISRAWARHTVDNPYTGFRVQHRMPPILYKSLVIQGNGIDGIRAYNKQSGRLVWAFPLKGGVEIGATLAGDKVFFGANDGFFYGLNADTGDVLWSFPLKAEGLGAPVVDGDNVYFLSANNTAYALKIASGEQVWVYNRIESTNLNVRGTAEPIILGSNLLLGFSDGAFVALDKARGSVIWERQLGTGIRFKDVDSKAVVDGDRVYVSSYDGQLYCLSSGDGRTLWSNEEGGYSAVTIEGDTLYYASSMGKVIALDKGSGKLIWSKKINRSIATQPVFFKGLVIYGEWDGSLRAVDARTGAEVSHYSTGRGVASTPIIDTTTNIIYLTSVDANLFALRTGWTTNAHKWAWEH